MEGSRLGPYELMREIGSGGMGTVYLAKVATPATPEEEEARLAVKVVHPHLLATPGFFKRFLREGEIGRRIRHENVVATLDADGTDVDGKTALFLSMEYVEGQNLRSLLDELVSVPEELCRHIGHEVAQALSAIHAAGAIHRDLKPENVLITEDHRVKVMDLGVARLTDEEAGLSMDGHFVGSVRYGAPEQFTRSSDRLDERVDLYATGLLLYELATGRHPFEGDAPGSIMHKHIQEEARPVGELNPQLSPFFEELVKKLLAKAPDARFATAEELGAVLAAGEESDWWADQARAIREKTRQPLRQVRVPRETALYGREDQLAQLCSLFSAAESGEGRVALVEGEAGIGKTRIVDELAGRLGRDGRDLHFLFGGFPPGGAATAASALAAALAAHFGQQDLTQVLNHYLPTRPVLVPALAALIRGEPPPTGVDPLTRESLQTILVQTVRALAAEKPVLLLVDDLHFAPEEGRALFASLALAVPGHRVLLVGTSRDGLPEDWLSEIERLEQTARVGLPRLGPKDLGRLLVDAFHSERLAEELGWQIAQKSDGNPLFVFEIIRGLREGRLIAQSEDGTWDRTQVIGEIQIPSSVLDLIQARIAALEEEEKELLDVASCLGFEFDPLLVADALGLGQIPAMKRLAHIERRHRIVRAVGRRYVFDHHQVQSAFYDGLPELLREPYHAALAEALERRQGAADGEPADLDGRVAADLCRHYLLGARGEQARRYLEAALDHMVSGYQNDAAIGLADLALSRQGLLDGAARARVLLRKAGRLGVLGRRTEEREVLDEALTIADAAGDPALCARVLRLLGMHFLGVHAREEAGERLASALEFARQAGDREEEGAVLLHLGAACKDLGSLEEAQRQYEQAIEILRDVGHGKREVLALGRLGIVELLRGRREKGKQLFWQALALAREIGDRQGEGIVTGNLGITLQQQGWFESSGAHHETQLALARESGYRRGEGSALGSLGWIAVARGRYAEAIDRFERWISISSETADKFSHGYARLSLAQVLAALGDLGGAREIVEEVAAFADRGGSQIGAGSARHVLGEFAEQAGEHEAAESFYRQALEIWEGATYEAGRANTLASLGRLLAETERQDEGRALLTQALELGVEMESPATIVSAKAALGLVPGTVEPDEIAATLEEYEPRVDVRTRVRVGHLLWQLTGERAHLEKAHRLLLEGREHAPEAYRESMLANIPLHAAIVAAATASE